jgi:starch phosphorylase
MDGLVRLASTDGHDASRFDLGALAIRFASVVNGVSKRHGEVVAADWRHLITGTATSITNGVHTPTWIGRNGAEILVRNLGRSWPTRLLQSPELLQEAADIIPDHVIWEAHAARKQIFARHAHDRLRVQMARQGASPDELRAIETMFQTDRLTLGFARRFATYKRATLMFWDRDRLASILRDAQRPVQVVFAGKAHPADLHGQAFIRQIVELARSDEFRGYVYFIENYDARLARFMVQGVDVWVNNPRPPMEASGTSGMKAAINGTLNLSVLDGWWLEGYDGTNGWAFGSADENPDWGAADGHDAWSLYETLTKEVAPLYYDREPDGLPKGWIEKMRASIVTSIRDFSTHRMVAEYFDRAYLPLAGGGE